MPFTFSHPAIVLPLGLLPKRLISVTGLVVGSMAPDFEYFLRLRILAYYGHSWRGIFYFDLPASLLAAYLFHTIIRNPLIFHLPGFLRSRFSPLTDFNWNKRMAQAWPIVTISILPGAASHILWDGFTHRDGMFVKMLPALQANLYYLDLKVPLFKILQHGCTALGAWIIVTATLMQPRQSPGILKARGFYWIPIFLITILFSIVRFTFRIGNTDEIIATAIAGFLLALSLVSAVARYGNPSSYAEIHGKRS